MKSLLEFNPYFRPSAKELVAHPFFDDIRVVSNEHSSKEKLTLDVDKDENFNPDTS